MALKGRAKVFVHGGSQAVRLPREFRLHGTEAEVSRTATGGVLIDPLGAGFEARHSRFIALAGPCSSLLNGAVPRPARSVAAAPVWLPDADTICTYLLGANSSLVDKMSEAFGGLCLSAVVLTACGIAAPVRANIHLRLKLAEFARLVAVEPFKLEDCFCHASISHDIGANKHHLSQTDLLVAAQAMRLGATVISTRVADFSCIPGIKVESWGK